MAQIVSFIDLLGFFVFLNNPHRGCWSAGRSIDLDESKHCLNFLVYKPFRFLNLINILHPGCWSAGHFINRNESVRRPHFYLLFTGLSVCQYYFSLDTRLLACVSHHLFDCLFNNFTIILEFQSLRITVRLWQVGQGTRNDLSAKR